MTPTQALSTSVLRQDISASASSADSKYNLALGYLRAFVVVLVVAHHAMLAYVPFAAPPAPSLLQQPRLWQIFPVVDPHRSGGFALLVGFNDTFFMSLMFFLSGLFVCNSVRRKGISTFLRDRLLRLGIPFVVAAGLLAPLAYYPSYLQLSVHSSQDGFWKQWLALGNWPAGPAWFIWVLFVFDCIAAALFFLAPKWNNAIGRLSVATRNRPFRFFAVLVAISAAAYIPMALAFNPLAWSAFGPFTFQTSRILHYLVYFLIGTAIGAAGIENGLLSPGGKLARRWFLWVIAAPILFFVEVAIATMTIAAVKNNTSPIQWETVADLGFVLCCATACFACLALFLRFANNRVNWSNSLANSSYGVYLVHYAFVSWLQYLLLASALPGVIKGALVFIGAVALSWMTISLLRRAAAIRRIV